VVENHVRDHVAADLRKTFDQKHTSYANLFEIERFNRMWNSGLGNYVCNLRHAGRLLSSFKFHLGAFQSNDAEVNPLDLFVLETLRLYEPSVYQAVQRSADRLFPSWEYSMIQAGRTEKVPDPWETTLDDLSKSGAGNIIQSARNLLKELFPGNTLTNTPFEPSQESMTLQRQRCVCHILYFNRYFRLTIDEADLPDQRISELQNQFDNPAEFIRSLQELANHGSLPLALTKLLARENLIASSKPIEMVTAMCNFADQLDEITQPPYCIRFSTAVQRIVDLQLPSDLGSSKRLENLSQAIKNSNAIHVPVQIAEAEDLHEHHYSGADDRERRTLKQLLTRADVEQLNELVAERLENSIRESRVQLCHTWTDSLRWYLNFIPGRSLSNADLLLAQSTTVAVLLSVIITAQTIENYFPHPNQHFAQSPLLLVKTGLGLERFDAALNKHSEALLAEGNEVTKRLEIYRDMRKRFPKLADQLPQTVADSED
jgi:hypothetical protein